MFNRKSLIILSMVILLLAACGGRVTPTPTDAPVALPDSEPAVTDVTGDWTGNLNDLVVGVTCTMDLTLNQAPDMTVTGNVHFTCPSTNELYDVNGTFDGTTLHIQDPYGRFFTATLSGETMTGYVGRDVYDDGNNAWGQYTLTRGSAGSSEGVVPSGGLTTDPQGTWSGLIQFTDGSTAFSLATLSAQSGDTWGASFSWVLPSFGVFYLMQGNLENGTLKLLDTTGSKSLNASIQAGNLTGYLAPGCFDCPEQANETFSLLRTENNTLQPDFGVTSFDSSGTWNGTLLFKREIDNLYNMIATLTQIPGSSDISGQVILSNSTGYSETHQVTGQISSTYIFLDDTLTSPTPMYFWGSVSDHEIYGYMSSYAYDTPQDAMAIFYVYRP